MSINLSFLYGSIGDRAASTSQHLDWTSWTGRTSSAIQRRNQPLGNPSVPLGQDTHLVYADHAVTGLA